MAYVKHEWRKLKEGKGVTCPICGHDHACMIADDNSAVWCRRVRDGCARRADGSEIAARDGMGWLHRLDDDRRTTVGRSMALPSSKAAPRRLSTAELQVLIKQHRTAINPNRLRRYADSIGVSVRALEAYGIGYDSERGCHSFPMYDGKRKPCGLKLRADDGRKFCVPGSQSGLFVPVDYAVNPIPEGVCDDPYPLLLLLPEGMTDCAAARDLGFRAVGRPSNNGGADMLLEFLSEDAKQDVILLGEQDGIRWLKDQRGNPTEPFWPGIEGPMGLAAKILMACGTLRFMMPPDHAKDLRQWFIDHGHGDLLPAILKAPQVTPGWLRKAEDRLTRMRAEEKAKLREGCPA